VDDEKHVREAAQEAAGAGGVPAGQDEAVAAGRQGGQQFLERVAQAGEAFEGPQLQDLIGGIVAGSPLRADHRGAQAVVNTGAAWSDPLRSRRETAAPGARGAQE
jgi:hypothetical protein